MRKSMLYLSAVVITSMLLFSFIKISPQEKDTGAVGDVKYSILEPVKFRAQNGEGWILLDGGANSEAADLYQTSTLKTVLQFPSLPDARGVFLRGMNKGRDISTGDVDGDRNAGDPQLDEFKKHDHDVSFMGRKGDIVGFHVEGGGGDPIQRINWGDRLPYGGAKNNIIVEPRGISAETRPRNIALYVYIKIN